MFKKEVYVKRRNSLRKKIDSGLVFFLGNVDSPMNYPANTYPFRQDSNFLYFFGLDIPGLAGIIDVDEGKDYLFGEDFTIDDIIWMGPQPTVKELAKKCAITNVGNMNKLTEMISRAIAQGKKIHFLPPYRPENAMKLEQLLGIANSVLKRYSSRELIRSIVELRSVKSKEEINEIEKALDISYLMYSIVMKMAKPGVYEREIVGKIEGVVGSRGGMIAFPIILTVNGETLHNHYHGNRLQKNDLLLVDSGSESSRHYASDITRTFPVGGKFTSLQKEIYEIVLASQLEAIKAIKPGIKYRNVHLKSAKVIAAGLKEIGLIKGNINDVVKVGAHALFFPHGIGHMMGLDVHDMEDLGEDLVGYSNKIKRSDQFGLAYLRLAKELRQNYVLTVEPGIYFIPQLIDKWKAENKFSEFINYSQLEKFRKFGGVRIEDNVLVTAKGSKVLGKPIPKKVSEIENIMTNQ